MKASTEMLWQRCLKSNVHDRGASVREGRERKHCRSCFVFSLFLLANSTRRPITVNDSELLLPQGGALFSVYKHHCFESVE